MYVRFRQKQSQTENGQDNEEVCNTFLTDLNKPMPQARTLLLFMTLHAALSNKLSLVSGVINSTWNISSQLLNKNWNSGHVAPGPCIFEMHGKTKIFNFKYKSKRVPDFYVLLQSP